MLVLIREVPLYIIRIIILTHEFKITNISIIIGIGQGRITNNLEGSPVDSAVFVPDSEAIEMV